MIWLDSRLGIGHVGGTLVRDLEQSRSGLEHFFRKLAEEVSGETTHVLASLARVLDGHFASEFVGRQVRKLGEGIVHDVGSVSSHVEGEVPGKTTSSQLFDLLLEIHSLVLEVEQVRHEPDELGDGGNVFRGGFFVLCTSDVNCLDKFVQKSFVLEAEAIEGVETVGGVLDIAEYGCLSRGPWLLHWNIFT